MVMVGGGHCKICARNVCDYAHFGYKSCPFRVNDSVRPVVAMKKRTVNRCPPGSHAYVV